MSQWAGSGSIGQRKSDATPHQGNVSTTFIASDIGFLPRLGRIAPAFGGPREGVRFAGRLTQHRQEYTRAALADSSTIRRTASEARAAPRVGREEIVMAETPSGRRSARGIARALPLGALLLVASALIPAAGLAQEATPSAALLA